MGSHFFAFLDVVVFIAVENEGGLIILVPLPLDPFDPSTVLVSPEYVLLTPLPVIAVAPPVSVAAPASTIPYYCCVSIIVTDTGIYASLCCFIVFHWVHTNVTYILSK